jgi:hypothetical protein
MATCRKGGCDKCHVGPRGFCVQHDPVEVLLRQMAEDDVQRLRWASMMPSAWNRYPRWPSRKEW